MVKESSAKIDILLEPLLREASDEQADEILSRLITVHAEPVIKGIIRYKLHLNRADGRAEADDVYQEALVQLVAELQQLRRQPDEHPITDVRGIANVGGSLIHILLLIAAIVLIINLFSGRRTVV